jgi:hypothetical protein
MVCSLFNNCGYVGCDIVVLYVDTSLSEEHAVFILLGGVDEAQSKPIGMVNRKCRKNKDSYGSECSHSL